MARYIYARVSTDHQDYPQQRNTINRYLQSSGIPLDSIDAEVVEKITGTKDHTERKFAKLFAKCKSGDTIYFSELSRIGRSMSDLNNIVHQACKSGIILMQCKDGTRIEDESISGKALLFALSLAAEIEVANLHQRTKSGVEVALKELKENGQRITKAGTVQKHWGNKKGCDMSAAQEAAAKAHQDALAIWREESKAYKWAIAQIKKGKTRKVVVQEFNELHTDQPTVYCTRNGRPLSEAVLSKWISMTNMLMAV